ncbi:MAG TPA: GNAT family N-acetyltransferase, partial [Jatrophihabitantaceae bacterium]|nr:GNAT family N-acetyltransferase [Jatrophihabitantaceae bacterium]
DAVLLITARVQPEFAGAGLGRMLVQAVVGDVARRGLKAVEAFGTQKADDADKHTHTCVLPSDYLLAVGFKTVRPHPEFPRLRLDVKSTVSWKEDVEYAIDRLFATITPTPSAVSRG